MPRDVETRKSEKLHGSLESGSSSLQLSRVQSWNFPTVLTATVDAHTPIYCLWICVRLCMQSVLIICSRKCLIFGFIRSIICPFLCYAIKWKKTEFCSFFRVLQWVCFTCISCSFDASRSLFLFLYLLCVLSLYWMEFIPFVNALESLFFSLGLLSLEVASTMSNVSRAALYR